MCKSSQRGFQEGTKGCIVPGTRNHKEVQEVQEGTRRYYGTMVDGTWRCVWCKQMCFMHKSASLTINQPQGCLPAFASFILCRSFEGTSQILRGSLILWQHFQPVGIELMQTLSLFHPGGFLEASDVHQLLYGNTFRRGGLSGVQIATEFWRNSILCEKENWKESEKERLKPFFFYLSSINLKLYKSPDWNRVAGKEGAFRRNSRIRLSPCIDFNFSMNTILSIHWKVTYIERKARPITYLDETYLWLKWLIAQLKWFVSLIFVGRYANIQIQKT